VKTLAILLVIAALYWLFLRSLGRCLRDKFDDIELDHFTDDGNPLTTDRPETNVERAERYRRAAAHSRKQP